MMLTKKAVNISSSAISSKSEVIRHIICAMLCKEKTVIYSSNHCNDIAAALKCASSLGAYTEATANTITILPPLARKSECEIYCGDSAALLRFLLPVSPFLCERTHFTASVQLSARPVSSYISLLSQHGIEFTAGRLPFTSTGKLTGGAYVLRGDVSSQYISGLMLALPLLNGSSIITTTPLLSSDYVELTRVIQQKYGVKTACGNIDGNQKYISSGEYTPGGCWSSAAALLSLGAVSGKAEVRGLDVLSSQPEKRILSLLKLFGADIYEKSGIITVTSNKLSAISADISQCIDLFPVLAAIASVSGGTSVFTGIERLKYKETSRADTVCAALSAIGADISVTDNYVTVHGKSALDGGRTSSFGDHRVAMAVAVASLKCKNGVYLENANAVYKSFPDFFAEAGL